MNLSDIEKENGLNERRNSGESSVSDFSLFGSSSAALAMNPSLLMTPFSKAGLPPSALPTDFNLSQKEHEQVWPKRFACNFIEPGLVRYQGSDGAPDDMVLIEEDVLEKIAKSIIGKPVVDWDHIDVWPSMIAEGKADGIVSDVWKGDDGWWHCAFEVWSPEAIKHCESGKWFVSCAYMPTDVDKRGGRHHNVPYTEKVLDAEYTHLALVENPRYENARIRANSKTEENGGYKMAFKWMSLMPSLRLNAEKGEGKVLIEVDGEPVEAKELFAALADEERDGKVLHGNDDDEVEFEGKKAKLKDLKNAFRKRAKKNAEDEEKKEEERKAKEEEAKNDRGGHHEPVIPQGGAAQDNPDEGVKAGEGISLKAQKEMQERLQSLEKQLVALKNAKSDELRNSVEFGSIPLGAVPDARPIMTIQDRLAAGKARMNSYAGKEVKS